MSKASRNIITFAVIFFFVAIAVVFSVVNTRKTIVPEDAVGNTPGNLNNDGLFCESSGKVYFANAYDEGTIYSMNPDQSEITKLSDLKAKYINAGGDYLFFYGNTSSASTGLGSIVAKPSLIQLDKGGEHPSALTKEIVQNMVLCGNKIFVQHYKESTGTTTAVVDIKKRSLEDILDYMINPSCLHNNYIYFNGMYKDHFLYALNTNTYEVATLWEGDLWNPIYSGGYIYYMDVQNDYRLCRYSLNDNTIEIITKDRADFFNLYGDVIFYQKNSVKEPALKRIRTDGSGEEIVAYGNYSEVNITSTYAYFREFGTDYPVYYTPTTGPVNVNEFTKAREALLANIKRK